jgi:coiled-coil-helix-coiled-coil-helix domain-containing protein 2
MLSNIVSTAAGVGIGHAIGHGITGLFSGGSSTPAEASTAAATNTTDSRLGACDADAKAFTRCMDDYKGDMSACSWYLEQLKSCQQMASQY